MSTNEDADRTQTMDLTELQVKTHPALADVLEADRGEQHIIVLQDFPDPDAISSAFAHRLISVEYGIETDILYSGRISHQQNTALVKLLDISLVRYSASMELDQYDEEFIESKWQVYDTQIRQKLLATLGVQQESGK